MPRRRCVGCGRIAPKSELVRLVATDRRSASEGDGRPRRAVIDPAGTLPGRGAYLCGIEGGAAGQGPASRAPLLQSDAAGRTPNRDCLRLAERRRGIARALRCAVTLGPEFVESVN